ncbi:hypothetical protein M8C21_009816, partial [Ambrosia artemisiifolia]
MVETNAVLVGMMMTESLFVFNHSDGLKLQAIRLGLYRSDYKLDYQPELRQLQRNTFMGFLRTIGRYESIYKYIIVARHLAYMRLAPQFSGP